MRPIPFSFFPWFLPFHHFFPIQFSVSGMYFVTLSILVFSILISISDPGSIFWLNSFLILFSGFLCWGPLLFLSDLSCFLLGERYRLIVVYLSSLIFIPFPAHSIFLNMSFSANEKNFGESISHCLTSILSGTGFVFSCNI